MSWIGGQLLKYAAASTLIILLEGLSAILSPPSPHPTKYRFRSLCAYQLQVIFVPRRAFLYLGEHVYEKQCWISQPLKDGSKMEIVFQRKWYCTEIQPSKWFSKKQWPRRQFTENPSWHTAVGISDWNKNEEGRKCGWRQMGNRYKIYNNNLIFGFMLVPYDSENKTFQCMGDKMTIQVILISILKIASRPLNASF